MLLFIILKLNGGYVKTRISEAHIKRVTWISLRTVSLTIPEFQNYSVITRLVTQNGHGSETVWNNDLVRTKPRYGSLKKDDEQAMMTLCLYSRVRCVKVKIKLWAHSVLILWTRSSSKQLKFQFLSQGKHTEWKKCYRRTAKAYSLLSRLLVARSEWAPTKAML